VYSLAPHLLFFSKLEVHITLLDPLDLSQG
jgi:hypothetical protein